MTLLSPIALGTIGLIAAILGGLLVVAYILRMRRRRFEVPFSMLWHRVFREKESSSLWKHLRRILSFLLLAAILGSLLFGSTEPRLGAADADARSVVILFDASASMRTVDEGDDGNRMRVAVAREKTIALLDAMGAGDSAMLMRMDGQTTPLSRFETDKSLLKKTITDLEPSDTPADLRRALSAASDALRERQNPLIVIVGDGAYPEAVLQSVVLGEKPAPGATDSAAPPTEGADDDKTQRAANKKLAEIDLRGIDLRYIPIGKSGENVGIIAFNARRYVANKQSYEVLLEVQNFGKEPAKRKLVIYNGDSAIDVKSIELAPGERKRQIYPKLSGGDDNVLRASLEKVIDEADDGSPSRATGDDKRDILPLDDEAFALLPARKKQRVLLVMEDNLYLEAAMLVYDNIEVDKVTGAEYLQALEKGDLSVYNIVVFDSFTPEEVPTHGAHLLYINPEGEHSPFTAGKRKLRAPRVTQVNENHPVMRWIDLSDVYFDDASVFSVNRQGGEVWLAKSARSTIAVAKRTGKRKMVGLGWSIGTKQADQESGEMAKSGTDLVMRVAFPLIFVNALDWFAGDDADLNTTYKTGHRLRLKMDGAFAANEADVSMPDGRSAKAPLRDGIATFYASRVGVYKLTAETENGSVSQLELAANLSDPDESDVAPSTELIVFDKPLEEPAGFKITRRQSLWLYFALFAAILLLVEWLTYNRRITV